MQHCCIQGQSTWIRVHAPVATFRLQQCSWEQKPGPCSEAGFSSLTKPPPDEPIYVETMICCLRIIKCEKRNEVRGCIYFFLSSIARATKHQQSRCSSTATHGGRSEVPSAPSASHFFLFCALHVITASTPLHCLLLTPNERPAGQLLPSLHCCQTQTDCSNATRSIFSADPLPVPVPVPGSSSSLVDYILISHFSCVIFLGLL